MPVYAGKLIDAVAGAAGDRAAGRDGAIIALGAMVALGLLLLGGAGARLVWLGWLPMAWIGGTLLWIAAALTLITGWDYLNAGLRHVTAHHP